jgi:hypothetical protein
MAHFSPDELDRIERAVAAGSRVAVFRRGSEFVVIPTALEMVQGRDVLACAHPTTGEPMRFDLAEVDAIEVIR